MRKTSTAVVVLSIFMSVLAAALRADEEPAKLGRSYLDQGDFGRAIGCFEKPRSRGNPGSRTSASSRP